MPCNDKIEKRCEGISRLHGGGGGGEEMRGLEGREKAFIIYCCRHNISL